MRLANIALSVGLLSATVFAQAQKLSKNFKIAYNILENKEKDDYDIYTMNTDGSGKTNITRHPDVAWTYHAFDNKLYWISDRDTCARCYFLYESDALGRNVRKVTSLRLEDSWMGSRNAGRELIVSGRIDKEVRNQLFLVDVATGSFRQITRDTAARYNDPTFSPDGKQIVYRYKPHKRDRYEKSELWIANADGTSARQLTHYPASDTTAEWHSYHAGPPHWNKKLGLITYQSKQGGKYRLFAVTPDGSRQFEFAQFSLGAGWHDWSPDGRWLAVELFPDESSPGDIYLYDSQTKRLKQLTQGPGFKQSPVWVRK